MKTLKWIVAIYLVVICGDVYGQKVQGAPNGNLIWLSPDNTNISDGIISRKGAADSDYRRIGETTVPGTREEIEKRNSLWQKDFPHLKPLSDLDKSELLEMAVKKLVPKNNPLKYNPVAKGIIGQVWYDKQTPAGIRLSYKVSLSGTDKIVEAPFWPAKVKLPVAVSPEVTESPDRIHVKWEMKGDANADGFVVYRRAALKGEFQSHKSNGGFSQLDKKWYLLITDTLVEPLAMYEYKAAAIDKLGNEGDLSDPVKARVRGENLLPYFSEMSGKSNDDGQVIVKWKLMMPQLARSINIYRSLYFDKEFILVGRAAVSDSIFEDKTADPNENQYYKLEVLMDEGSRTSIVVSVMGKFNDKTHPPQIISVTSDKDLVTIKWVPDPSSVYGYYVYMQNAIGSPVIQVSHLIAPDSGVFAHKAITDGKSYTYYYSVSAVGHDYKVSERSTPVEVMVYGMSKLDPPSGLEATVRDDKAVLVWKEQFSMNENIIGYTVYKKMAGEKQYTKINTDTLNPGMNYFADDKYSAKNPCTYKVEVRDYFGAIAFAEVELKAKSDVLMPPQHLIVSGTSSGVSLRWEQTNQTIKAIRVYGYEAGQKPKLLAELKSTETTYQDKTATKGKMMNYFITYISLDGNESGGGVIKSIAVN